MMHRKTLETLLRLHFLNGVSCERGFKGIVFPNHHFKDLLCCLNLLFLGYLICKGTSVLAKNGNINT